MRRQIKKSIPNSDVFIVEYKHTKTFWEKWGVAVGIAIAAAIGIVTIVIQD